MKWLLPLGAWMAVQCLSSFAMASTSSFPMDESEMAFSTQGSSRFDRVIYIVMENTNYDSAMKISIFKNFADQGIQFDQLLAQTHPSQGNYIAMIAGDKLGVNSDANFDIPATQRHLGNLLEEKGMDWKVYAEGYPGNCFTGARSGKYARKHVPFISFLNVSKVPDRCAKIVNSNTFLSDWSNHRLPAFSMYIPDLNNDGHDTGAAFAANWFQKTFGPALKDPRLMDRTLVVLTFDEAEGYFGVNKIYTAMSSPQLPSKIHIKSQHTHYSLLKFIEDEWALGNLGRGDSKAPVIQELKAKSH